MSMYTKDVKDPGDIYFLNDDNIAFVKDSESCKAGFNAVASQQEFVEAYGEFGQVSSDLYGLSDSAQTSAETLYGMINGVSAAADGKFLPLSGGQIDHLSVANGLTAKGVIDTDYIKTNSTGDITVRGANNGHGSIDVQFEGGMNSISVNGQSLSSYIRTAVTDLDVATVQAGQGQIVDTVSERDGLLSVAFRNLVSSDIPELPVSKIKRLEDDYATKQYTLSRIGEIEIQYDEDLRRIWVVNPTASLSSFIEADRFVKDGMIDSVEIRDGDSGHLIGEGPYVVITWNTDAGKSETWLKIRDFANLYSSDDPGLNVGVNGDKFKLALNYDVVAKADVLSGVVAYVEELSAPVVGTIDQLSANIESVLSSEALTVKFLGHIRLNAAEATPRSFSQILEDSGLYDEHVRVKNGSMFQVSLFNEHDEPVVPEAKYVTADGLSLGDGDYIYVHKHGFDAYIQASEIAVSGESKTVYIANPVHKYDIRELREFVIDNFVKLSGNNDISADNVFRGNLSVMQDLYVGGSEYVSGSAYFESDLSVGFDKLYDLRNGKSLQGLCADLSDEIVALSIALSGEIDDLSAKLSGEIEDLSTALSGEIEDLSAALSGEIDDLSAKLSGEIDDLSIALSSEISCRAMLSVDGVATNEFHFLHISRDDYHDLVLSVGGESGDQTTDPNTLYVVSSEGMCMYGEKITDLAYGEDPNDAVAFGQLSAMRETIYNAINKTLSSVDLESNYDIKLGQIIQCLVDIRDALSA